MAKGNLARVMPHVFAHEGGYVDHPDDPGGATKYGITLGTLRAWRRRPLGKADVQALSAAEATAIYETIYAKAIRFDDLPPGLDYAVLDLAINSGPKRAAELLQRMLGIAADGIVGPKTCATAQTANPADTIHRLCDARLKFLRGLGTYKRFGKGWERRVAEVRSVALELASPDSADPRPPHPSPSATSSPIQLGCPGLGIETSEHGNIRLRREERVIPPPPDIEPPEPDAEEAPSTALVMIIAGTVGLLLLLGFGASLTSGVPDAGLF
jgi:lysozyme family protein